MNHYTQGAARWRSFGFQKSESNKIWNFVWSRQFGYTFCKRLNKVSLNTLNVITLFILIITIHTGCSRSPRTPFNIGKYLPEEKIPIQKISIQCWPWILPLNWTSSSFDGEIHNFKWDRPTFNPADGKCYDHL